MIKLFFILFVLLLSFCINPQTDIFCDLQTPTCIQNDYKNIVMVSNPMRGEEILSNEANDNSNSIGPNDVAVELTFLEKSFSKNTTRLNRESIHNLSTNEKQIVSIRAP